MDKKRFFSLLFKIAAIFNIAFGLTLLFEPLLFFKIFHIPQINYPFLVSLIGILISIYGYGYWVVCQNINKYPHIIVMGLLCKIVTTIGWIYHIYVGNIPLQTISINFISDIIWIPFFIWYLQWNHDLRYGKY